jgi:tetratricopeptide (TPR) repeat protein
VHAQAAVKLDAKSTTAWQVLGWARYRSGDWKGSIDALQKSVELQNNTGDPWQWLFLAMAHWQLGQKEQAGNWYAKSAASMHGRDPKRGNNREGFQFLAETEKLMGMSAADRLKIVLDYYARRIAKDPDDFEACVQRGDIFLKLRRWPEAAADLWKAVELKPDHHRARLNLARTFKWQKNYDGTIEHCNEVLRIDPKDASAYFHRGDAYRQKGNYAAATNDFDAAIQLDPKFPYAYSARGEVSGRMRAWRKAAHDFQKFTDLGPPRHHVWKKLALLRVITGDMAGYRRICAHAAQVCRTNQDPLLLESLVAICGYAPQALDDLEPIRQLAASVVKRRPKDAGSLFNLGLILYRMGRFEEAVRQFEAAVKFAPELSIYRRRLMMAKHRLGESSETRAFLKRTIREIDGMDPAKTYWFSLLKYELMRREAEQLLRLPVVAPKPKHYRPRTTDKSQSRRIRKNSAPRQQRIG